MSRTEALEEFLKRCFRDGVADGCDVGGDDIQDWCVELGLAEWRLPEPGSREAEEWGEDEELCYLVGETGQPSVPGNND